MKNIVNLLRSNARNEAKEGEYHPEEHIDWMAADYIEELEAGSPKTAEGVLNEFQQQTFEWSVKTFGVRPPSGPINHLKEECDEIIEAPHDLEEYADAYLLIQDAASRAGFKMSQLLEAAVHKHAKNTQREWPPRGETNEHGFTKHKK